MNSKDVVIRWWVEVGRSSQGSVEYNYECIVGGNKTRMGELDSKEALEDIRNDYIKRGYDVTFEEGSYSGWVPKI